MKINTYLIIPLIFVIWNCNSPATADKNECIINPKIIRSYDSPAPDAVSMNVYINNSTPYDFISTIKTGRVYSKIDGKKKEITHVYAISFDSLSGSMIFRYSTSDYIQLNLREFEYLEEKIKKNIELIITESDSTKITYHFELCK